MTDTDLITSLIEEVGLVHNAPPSLLKGKGGVRNAQVALARKVCWWVLARRGISVDTIARIFKRTWSTIVAGLRWTDRELSGSTPPDWSTDIYALANVTFDSLLWWAVRLLPKDKRNAVYAYCQGVLMSKKGYAVTQQLDGLRLLARDPATRRGVIWAFKSTEGTDPTWSVKYHAQKLGYAYEP